MKHKKQKIALTAVALMLLGIAAYVGDYYRADETAVQAMSAARLEASLLVFGPEDADTGFIFYPGGKVEAAAYAPLMRKLAENDVLCVIAQMPLNLAVLDVNAADGVAERFAQVERWYIGGHSLGGSMAASYAAGHADELEGLVLLAAYSTEDLTDSSLDVISLYGSEDGVLDMEKYERYLGNLPADVRQVVIEGGCHAGFGSYGPQQGDGTPTISGETQQQITAEALSNFFGERGGKE